MAERQRFELWRDVNPLLVFETSPFNHLGIAPKKLRKYYSKPKAKKNHFFCMAGKKGRIVT